MGARQFTKKAIVSSSETNLARGHLWPCAQWHFGPVVNTPISKLTVVSSLETNYTRALASTSKRTRWSYVCTGQSENWRYLRAYGHSNTRGHSRPRANGHFGPTYVQANQKIGASFILLDTPTHVGTCGHVLTDPLVLRINKPMATCAGHTEHVGPHGHVCGTHRSPRL